MTNANALNRRCSNPHLHISCDQTFATRAASSSHITRLVPTSDLSLLFSETAVIIHGSEQMSSFPVTGVEPSSIFFTSSSLGRVHSESGVHGMQSPYMAWHPSLHAFLVHPHFPSAEQHGYGPAHEPTCAPHAPSKVMTCGSCAGDAASAFPDKQREPSCQRNILNVPFRVNTA